MPNSPKAGQTTLGMPVVTCPACKETYQPAISHHTCPAVPVACRFGVAGCDNTCHGDHNTERMFAELRANGTPPVPEALPEWVTALIKEGRRVTMMIRQAQGDAALDSVELLSSFQRLMYAFSLLADRLDAREREYTALQEKSRIDRIGAASVVRDYTSLSDQFDALTARAEQAERERENLRGYLRWCAARGGAEPVTYGSRLPECVGGLAYYTIAPPSGCTVGPARTFEEALDAAVERYIASRGSADHE